MDPRRGIGAHRGSGQGRRLRGPLRDESGSILVLFSIFLTMFLLCCAIVVDVGYWWANAKKAQIAADACALAAAGDPGFPKPYNQTHCNFGSPAREYVLTNIPSQAEPDKGALHLSTTVIAPYKATPRYVEATVRVRVRTFFGRIVGLDHIDLTRRAVAERQEGDPGNYAIYSHSPNCPTDPDFPGESLRFNGAEHSINGRVHSNGQFLINNGGDEPFWALIGTNVFCGEEIDPPRAARFFGPSYGESDEFLPRPVNEYNRDGILDYEHWPEWWTPEEFGWMSDACTVRGSLIEIDDSIVKVNGSQFGPPHGGVIPTGTYCSTGLFKIGGNNLEGEFTVLANEINVANGNNNNFKHAPGSPGDLFLFVVPNTDLNWDNDGGVDGKGPLTCSSDAKEKKMEVFNGNGGEWEGKIFNPCGLIQFDGNSASTLRGAIYGYQVHVNGNGFNMIGEGGDGGADAALALFE